MLDVRFADFFYPHPTLPPSLKLRRSKKATEGTAKQVLLRPFNYLRTGKLRINNTDDSPEPSLTIQLNNVIVFIA